MLTSGLALCICGGLRMNDDDGCLYAGIIFIVLFWLLTVILEGGTT